MPKQRRNAERQVALFVLGLVLLIPPVLVLVNRPDRIAGIPALYLYLFVAWTALIALAAVMTLHLGDGERRGDIAPKSQDAAGPGGGGPASHA